MDEEFLQVVDAYLNLVKAYQRLEEKYMELQRENDELKSHRNDYRPSVAVLLRISIVNMKQKRLSSMVVIDMLSTTVITKST